MEYLRLREVNNLPKVTQIDSSKPGLALGLFALKDMLFLIFTEPLDLWLYI
jgi:hypothetical protein